MTKSGLIKQLAAFLSENKSKIVRKIKVATPPHYSHTYGRGSQVGEEEIEVVDMEQLLRAMDEFGDQLRTEEREAKFHKSGKG